MFVNINEHIECRRQVGNLHLRYTYRYLLVKVSKSVCFSFDYVFKVILICAYRMWIRIYSYKWMRTKKNQWDTSTTTLIID